MLLLRRCAHTRAKTIPVQLLKERYGKRFAGEIFHVSEGHMRLKLHPEGIAAYVVKNEEPRIPVLSEAAAQQLRRQAQLKAKERLDRRRQSAGPAQPTPAEERRSTIESLLDTLDFDESAPDNVAAARQDAAANQTDAGDAGKPAEAPTFAWQSDIVREIREKK